MDMTLTGVAIRNRDEVFLSAILDEHADENPDHCMVLRHHGGVFRQLLLNHAVCAMPVPPAADLPMFFIGPHGDVTLAGSSGLSAESVDESDRGPSPMVLLRDAAWIGGALYACGMARMVYRRGRDGDWQAIDQGVFVPRETRDRAVGFHALGGRMEECIICVGQYGEIWWYDGMRWTQEDSPANVPLTGVCVREQGDVVVVGMAGVLLAGRPGAWRVVDHGATEADFWGIAEFYGDVYVSCYDGVFRLAGDTLEPVDMGAGPVSTGKLAAGDGVLWSVGAKDALYTADGAAWTRVPLPS